MSQPDLIVIPFGENATPGTIEPIPDVLTPSDPAQRASWNSGFPQITMVPLGAGGKPPRGQDFNGVLNAITRHSVFLGGGGQYKWSQDFVDSNGGYPLGSVVQSDDGMTSYVSTIEDNTINFNLNPSSIGVQWKVYCGSEISSENFRFRQIGSSSVPRSAQSKMREVFSVEDFGSTEGDSSSIINAAALALSSAGGGVLFFSKKQYLVGSPITVYSNVHYAGRGRGATVITAIAGSNTDIFKTKDFDSLTGVGNVADAPYAFSIKWLTIEGNYLDLSGSLTWRTSDTVLNSSGSAIKIFGSRYDIDVEVYNVADNALYSEGIGNFIENQEHASRIYLTGRISGQEGIVFRGPGDICLEYIVFGLTGHLRRGLRQTASQNLSKLYPTLGIVGLMLDNSGVYTGHAEIGFIHMYANCYNYGVYTLGTNRFNARHIVSENSLGGFYFGPGAHGVGAIIESRANGRMPDAYAGSSIVGLKDIHLDNANTLRMSISAKVDRYSPSRDFSGAFVEISGSNNNVRLVVGGQLQPGTNRPLFGDALKVTGDNNTVSVTGHRINGNFVEVDGNYNNVSGSGIGIYAGAALVRRNGFGNNINLTVGQLANDCTGFISEGTVGAENITLNLSGNEGYVPFSGDPMAALNRACTWTIAAVNGNSINGKTTEDYIEVSLPSSQVSGTVVVPHNFLYAPNRTQVSVGLSYPGTAPNQLCMVGIQGQPTATDVTITYRWAAIPTSGGANLQVHIR